MFLPCPVNITPLLSRQFVTDKRILSLTKLKKHLMKRHRLQWNKVIPIKIVAFRHAVVTEQHLQIPLFIHINPHEREKWEAADPLQMFGNNLSKT